ncbi:MAG: hypothetical protein QW037_00340 [Thermoplasmata archaeon]
MIVSFKDYPLLEKKMELVGDIISKYSSEITIAISDLNDAGNGKVIHVIIDYVKKTIIISDIFDLSELNILDMLFDDGFYFINIDGKVFTFVAIGGAANESYLF